MGSLGASFTLNTVLGDQKNYFGSLSAQVQQWPGTQGYHWLRPPAISVDADLAMFTQVSSLRKGYLGRFRDQWVCVGNE